ncbi:MAG: tetratricopeptide repeat protein [Actinomycetota bacterium]|nr:tetratricopeptide repeat protein [Actinomycetota bacterium]
MSDRPPSTSLLARAEALMALRRYDEAIPLLQEAATFEPYSALIRCQLAVCLLGVGQDHAAIGTAGEAIAFAPDDEWPHRIRARALLNLSRRRQALAAAREAARLAPDEVLTQAMLSEAELANYHWRPRPRRLAS